MNEKDETRLTGAAEILKKAMHVTKFNEMIDCFKQLKHHCKTIETDLVDVDFRAKTRPNHRIMLDENLTVESVSKRRFILLHDLIEETKRSVGYIFEKFSIIELQLLSDHCFSNQIERKNHIE